MTNGNEKSARFWWFPPSSWLRSYRLDFLPHDVVAGITLAAYAIPVSLAYAALAGLPPQAGIYGYLLGGLGYALLGSSRQLAVGPTSAISLMIAATVGAMAEGDTQRYAQIASLAAFTVAALSLIACRLAARSRAGWACAHNLRDISASTIRPVAEAMSVQNSHIAGSAPKRRLKPRASASRTRVEFDSCKFSQAEAKQ